MNPKSEQPYFDAGPTYSLAPREYICNECGFRHPVGRENNMAATEGGPVMLRHLRDEHDAELPCPIRDWREHVEPRGGVG